MMLSFFSLSSLTLADFAANGTVLAGGEIMGAGVPPMETGLLGSCHCGGGQVTFFGGESEAIFNDEYGCIGGCGGGAWEFHSSGQLLTKLEMWYGGGVPHDGVGAICMILTDGSHKCVGNHVDKGTKCEYTFDVANEERLWKLALHGNGVGTRLGRMEFKTIKADGSTGSFSCGNSHTAYWADNVDGKMIAGFFGQGGADIDQMGVILASPKCNVVSREIVKMECVNKHGQSCLSTWTDGGKFASVEQICNGCATSQQSTCAFDFTLSETHAVTTSSTSIDQLGGDVTIASEVSASFMGIVGVKETVTVGVHYSHTWESSKSQTETTTTSIGSKCATQLDGGHAVKAVGNVHAGDMVADMKFTVRTTTSCGQNDEEVHDATVTLTNVAVMAEVATCTFSDVDCDATTSPTPAPVAPTWQELDDTNIGGHGDLAGCAAYPGEDITSDPAKIDVCKQECIENAACVAIVAHPWGTMLKTVQSPTETASRFKTFLLTRPSEGTLQGTQEPLLGAEDETHARRYTDACLDTTASSTTSSPEDTSTKAPGSTSTRAPGSTSTRAPGSTSRAPRSTRGNSLTDRLGNRSGRVYRGVTRNNRVFGRRM